MKCPRCGTQTYKSIGGKYICPNCGYKSSVATSTPPETTLPEEKVTPHTDMQGRLREQWRKSKSSHEWAQIEHFFEELRKDENDTEVVEFLLSMLEELKESDGARIPMYAAIELVRRRKVDILPRLKRIRQSLPEMAGL